MLSVHTNLHTIYVKIDQCRLNFKHKLINQISNYYLTINYYHNKLFDIVGERLMSLMRPSVLLKVIRMLKPIILFIQNKLY